MTRSNSNYKKIHKTFFGAIFVCVVILILLVKDIMIRGGMIRTSRKLTNGPSFFRTSTSKPFRILHIVTSMRLVDNGFRGTVEGSDRLVNVVIPCISQFLNSIQRQEPTWEVDLYLILGDDTLELNRRKLIEDMLPPGVGLQVWEDAIPFSYDYEHPDVRLATHALARQHRFVIKDKFEHYDFFSAWEDDMMITADHVKYYINMMNQIEAARKFSENLQQQQEDISNDPKSFYGPMSADQLERVIPGFIRVEVLSNDAKSQEELDPISVAPHVRINASICCSNNLGGQAFDDNDVVLWETSIRAIGVRQFPEPIGWAGLLVGIHPSKNNYIGSYWSGEDGAFGKEATRPGRSGEMMAQQAGFMASKAQIMFFQKICPGGFLPPFNASYWSENSGLRPQNVEFWSGGYQLFGRCYLQRILSFEPQQFSKQLILHSANNKQRTIDRERIVKANHLLSQLYTVRENAAKRAREATLNKN